MGDILYNCRSALDHLANQLAGGRLNDHETFWPICIEPEDFTEKIAPFITRMPDGAETLMKESQPYQRGHKRPGNDVFAVLSKLSNADKHRHLHVGVVSIRSAAWFGDLDLKSFFGGLVEHRTKIASVAVAGPEVDVPLQFVLHVAIAHYRRWQMPIEVIRFFGEVITETEGIFARCLALGLFPE